MDKFTKGSRDNNKTHQLVILQFVAAMLPAALTLLFLELQDFRFNLSVNLISSLAFNGILASFLVTIIHTSVQRYTTPVKAALIFSLEPIVANGFAIIFINEILAKRIFRSRNSILRIVNF